MLLASSPSFARLRSLCYRVAVSRYTDHALQHDQASPTEALIVGLHRLNQANSSYSIYIATFSSACTLEWRLQKLEVQEFSVLQAGM